MVTDMFTSVFSDPTKKITCITLSQLNFGQIGLLVKFQVPNKNQIGGASPSPPRLPPPVFKNESTMGASCGDLAPPTFQLSYGWTMDSGESGLQTQP
jgi:hypothetical protein